MPVVSMGSPSIALTPDGGWATPQCTRSISLGRHSLVKNRNRVLNEGVAVRHSFPSHKVLYGTLSLFFFPGKMLHCLHGKSARRPRTPRPDPSPDRRRRPRRAPPLSRVLHRQHPQPQHPGRLRPGSFRVLPLVRDPGPARARGARARARRRLRRKPRQNPRRTVGETAPGGGAHAVRLARGRPGRQKQPRLGRARPQARR